MAARITSKKSKANETPEITNNKNKRAYHRPELVRYGSIQNITQTGMGTGNDNFTGNDNMSG